MKNLKTFSMLVCQLLTVAFLTLGYSQKHLWWGIIFVMVSLIIVWVGEKFHLSWLNYVVFGIQLFLAVGGTILGLPAYLMIAAAATALGSWDLSDLQNNPQQSSQHQLIKDFQLHRIKLLGITIFAGLAIAEIGLLIHFSIPFAVLFLIGLTILFCLYRLFTLLKG